MRINVTQQHITDGSRHSPRHCPIANALRYNFEGQTIKVIYSICSIGNRMYYLPSEVAEKIKRFDESGEMTPFEFELT